MEGKEKKLTLLVFHGWVSFFSPSNRSPSPPTRKKKKKEGIETSSPSPPPPPSPPPSLPAIERRDEREEGALNRKKPPEFITGEMGREARAEGRKEGHTWAERGGGGGGCAE